MTAAAVVAPKVLVEAAEVYEPIPIESFGYLVTPAWEALNYSDWGKIRWGAVPYWFESGTTGLYMGIDRLPPKGY